VTCIVPGHGVLFSALEAIFVPAEWAAWAELILTEPGIGGLAATLQARNVPWRLPSGVGAAVIDLPVSQHPIHVVDDQDVA
jgi:hypothetical protein